MKLVIELCARGGGSGINVGANLVYMESPVTKIGQETRNTMLLHFLFISKVSFRFSKFYFYFQKHVWTKIISLLEIRIHFWKSKKHFRDIFFLIPSYYVSPDRFWCKSDPWREIRNGYCPATPSSGTSLNNQLHIYYMDPRRV